MAYQSEAALEQQFIEQLNKQEYTTVAIPDYDALVENFKVQFEAFNAPKLDMNKVIYHIGLSYLLIALTSGNGSGPSTKG